MTIFGLNHLKKYDSTVKEVIGNKVKERVVDGIGKDLFQDCTT